MSAPHTLALQDGQAVPMRAWWRHSGHPHADDHDPSTLHASDDEDAGAGSSPGHARMHASGQASASGRSQAPLPAQQQPSGAAHSVRGGSGGSEWHDSVVQDWQASLKASCA